MEHNLFSPSKLPYVTGIAKPKVDCILCGVANKDPRVTQLDLYHSRHFIISLNLYPYNPGHLMVFPRQHLLDLRQLSQDEVVELHCLTRLSLDVLERVYSPHGFNVGYNLGLVSGASIEHLHLHIVPRYKNEIGFIDIVGKTRVQVEEPNETKEKLKEAFAIFADGGKREASPGTPDSC